MMRFVAGWIVALGFAAGCTVPSDVARTCISNADCEGAGGLCDTGVGLCYSEPEVDTCTPTCAAYEACTTGGCRPRFTELKILAPANNAVVNGETVQISAQLVANPKYTSTQYPETLSFRATRSDSGNEVGSFGSVTRNGANTYIGSWTLPAAQTQFTLTASHPMAGAVPSASVSVQVDTIAPTFSITFPSAPARTPGSPSQAEQKDPDPGYAEAYRRDESVTVTVSASEPVNNVILKVVGIASGGGAGAVLAPVAVQAGGTCAGSPAFCGTATVDLSLPEMNELRGAMQFQVEGADAAGNSGTASAGLKVTRWKWALDVAGPVNTSPAVSEKGIIYLGTASASGKVLAIDPEGRKRWEIDVEAVEGSPAVGGFNSGTEILYVASNFRNTGANGTRLRAIRGTDGEVLNTCDFTVSTGAVPAVVSAAAVAETMVPGGLVETGLFILPAGVSTAVGLRPSAPGSTAIECIISDVSQTMPDPVVGGALIATNTGQFVYATETRRILKYAFGGNAPLWTAIPGGGPGQRVFSMALLGNSLVAGGGNDYDQGGVFQIPFDMGAPVAPPLAGTENGRVYQFVTSGDDQLYFGRDLTGTTPHFVRYNLAQAGVIKSVPMSSALVAAPVHGSDGQVYTVSPFGELTVWSTSDLSARWHTFNLGTNAGSSPVIDCARSPEGTPAGTNRPGVIYFAANTKLHAIVIDSPRMSKEGWPKYQHDARNTGNPATPVTNCP